MRGSVNARFSVWFSARRRSANVATLASATSEAAHVERGKRRRSADDVNGCTALGARLGHRQRAIRKSEQRQRDAARRLLVAREPAKASGDHQVDHDEEVVVERDDDALAESANVE